MTDGRYIAIVYREEVDAHGNVTLRKVTTTRWLTVPQAAAALGISAKTLYRRIEEGALPVSRDKGDIRIAAEDFVDYCFARRQTEYERPEPGAPRTMIKLERTPEAECST